MSIIVTVVTIGIVFIDVIDAARVPTMFHRRGWSDLCDLCDLCDLYGWYGWCDRCD